MHVLLHIMRNISTAGLSRLSQTKWAIGLYLCGDKLSQFLLPAIRKAAALGQNGVIRRMVGGDDGV